MKIRTLEEIERDEAGRGTTYPVTAPVPAMADLRPGHVKRFLLGCGDLLVGVPRALGWLLALSLDLAVFLGIIGCIIFGLVYLFG